MSCIRLTNRQVYFHERKCPHFVYYVWLSNYSFLDVCSFVFSPVKSCCSFSLLFCIFFITVYVYSICSLLCLRVFLSIPVCMCAFLSVYVCSSLFLSVYLCSSQLLLFTCVPFISYVYMCSSQFLLFTCLFLSVLMFTCVILCFCLFLFVPICSCLFTFVPL